MDSKNKSAETSYLPVPWEYREVIEEEINKKSTGKIFFFDRDGQVAEAKGSVVRMTEEKGSGEFIVLDDGTKIRIDRIITLFGKVGAAYAEYDSYGSSCMDCTGGYDIDEL